MKEVLVKENSPSKKKEKLTVGEQCPKDFLILNLPKVTGSTFHKICHLWDDKSGNSNFRVNYYRQIYDDAHIVPRMEMIESFFMIVSRDDFGDYYLFNKTLDMIKKGLDKPFSSSPDWKMN